LAFAVSYLVSQFVTLIKYASGTNIAGFILAIASLCYLIVFIVVVVRYFRIPILVFAWLGAIHLMCVAAVAVLAIIGVIVISALISSAILAIVLIVVVIVIAGLYAIFTILTVIYSFKLARAIKQQQAYQLV